MSRTRSTFLPLLLTALFGWEQASAAQRPAARKPVARRPAAQKPAAQSPPERSSARPMSAEEKLVRHGYMKLMRYQAAAVEEAMAGQPGAAAAVDPDAYVSFGISHVRTGPIQEILGQPLAGLVAGRSGRVLEVTPKHLGAKGLTHASYAVAWGVVKGGEAEHRTLANRFASDPKRFQGVTSYTAYQVTVSLKGRTRRYKALALHRGKPSWPGGATTEIVDAVTPMLTDVLRERSFPIRSPWHAYLNSPLLRALAGERRLAAPARTPAGRPSLAADPLLGALPGDEIAAQLAAELADKCTVTISGPQTIDDGDTASFNVTTSGGTPTEYQWSFSAPSGSGNNPNVSFTPANGPDTTTNGHWFANPDQECTNLQSTYTIKAKVRFQGGQQKSADSSLTVSVARGVGGRTSWPSIGGDIQYGFDVSRNLYYVASNTLVRNPPQVTIPPNVSKSQFNNKAVTHEDKHVEQWETGMMRDVFQPASVWARIKDFTAPTTAELDAKVGAAAKAWNDEQVSTSRAKCRDMEQEAYGVSDRIAPRYLGQWNCVQNLICR